MRDGFVAARRLPPRNHPLVGTLSQVQIRNLYRFAGAIWNLAGPFPRRQTGRRLGSHHLVALCTVTRERGHRGEQMFRSEPHLAIRWRRKGPA